MRVLTPTTGNVIVYARVRNPDNKALLESLLVNLPGDRISPTLYEIFTADWDPGLWDETVERMESYIDPERDTLIFWQVVNGILARTSIAGRFA
ncbi:MAG TPA: hypothetical protein VGG19_16575 [Tepidisphaeraceae bacterium]